MCLVTPVFFLSLWCSVRQPERPRPLSVSSSTLAGGFSLAIPAA